MTRYYVWYKGADGWKQSGSHDGYEMLVDAVNEAIHHHRNGVEYKILTARTLT